MQALDKIKDAFVNFTPDTSAYSIGDSIGAGPLVFDVSGFVTGGGILNCLRVTDDDNEGAAGALWLFKPTLAGAAPTSVSDNAAFAPTITDLNNVITILTLPTFVTVNSLKIAILEDINTTFTTVNGRIYGYYVPSGTPTYASSKKINIELGILGQQ